MTPVVLTVPVALVAAGAFSLIQGASGAEAATALLPASYTTIARMAPETKQPYKPTRTSSVKTAAGASASATATPSTIVLNTSKHAFTQQVVDLTNVQRAKAGCGALTLSSTLASVAQAHSADMATHNYFSHTDLKGQSPFDRMTAAGYSYSSAGENIAAGQRTPSAVMQAWMKSPGHRANILNCGFTQIGVGYAGGGTYGRYWTQDFARPLSGTPAVISKATSTVAATPTSASSPTATSTDATGSGSASAEVSTGAYGLGMFMGNFSSSAFESATGVTAKVESIYYMANSVTTPRVAQHEAQIDQGISPLIDLSMKQGPYTQAQVAAWGSDVQDYFASFVAGLNTLANYAASKNNGTHVYFSYEHEAVIKINQNKYAAGLEPTIAQSAAAWNKVNSYVASAAPAAVRTYWYGGSGQNEDEMADALTPSLIQMATFDPYRWSHDKSTDTPESLWSGQISHLKAQSWMKNSDGSLKPWGLSEWGTDASFGDTSNAAFVSEALSYLDSQGAAFTIYFDRAVGADNFVISSGSEPKTLSAFTAMARASAT